jgi:uncharacterized Zn-finger protein
MKRNRVKKWARGGKPGQQNPIQVTCDHGHIIWVKATGPHRCPYCGGKKQYKVKDGGD